MRATILCLALFITASSCQGDIEPESPVVQTWPSNSNSDYMDAPPSNVSNPFGLLLLSQKVQLGSVSDFIEEAMVDSCNGVSDAAVNFYGCIENQTQISPLWAAMKLNATFLKIRTTQAIHINSENATSAMDTLWTVFNQDDMNLTDIASAIAQNIPVFCSDAQQLSQCLDPYISTCFPSNTSMSNAENTGMVDSSITYNSELFGLPLLDDQQQIKSFVSSMMSSACDSDGASLRTIMSNAVCIIESISNITDTCPNLFSFSTANSTDSTSTDPSTTDSSTTAPMTRPQKCSKMFRDIQCISQNLDAQCQDPALLNVLNVWGNTYFMSVGCPMALPTQ